MGKHVRKRDSTIVRVETGAMKRGVKVWRPMAPDKVEPRQDLLAGFKPTDFWK